MVFANTVLGLMIGLAITSDLDTASKFVVVMIIIAAIHYFNYTEDFIDAEKD